MRWIKSSGLAALIVAVAAGLAPSAAQAGQVLNFQLKGSSISGNFGTTQVIPCGTSTSTLFTFVSWNAFQAVQHGGGAPTTMLNAGVFIQQNNNCTGESVFDSAFVEGGITLTVNGIKSATLTGQFPLQATGGVLALNLTITQTGDTFQGLQFSRSNVGPMLFMSKVSSTSCDASNVAGTVALNGQNIPLVNLSDVGGSISNNNNGQLQIIGARTVQ